MTAGFILPFGTIGNPLTRQALRLLYSISKLASGTFSQFLCVSLRYSAALLSIFVFRILTVAAILGTVLAEGGELNLVLLIGIAIFGGTAGAKIFQKLRIPQVVGCVLVGVVLGGDCLNIISRETVEVIKPFTLLALGFIGFLIGGELRSDIFRRYGRQFFVILFSQGAGTFLLVAFGTSLAAHLVTGDWSVSIAMGLVFGAIASATAPAATTNVLWEYKTRGPLTAAILAIVALDDALALLLYRSAATGAQAFIGTGHDSIPATTFVLLVEIIGAVALGFVAGLVLYSLLKFVRSEERILGLAIALLLLVAGICIMHGIEPILPAMTFGVTVANMAKRQGRGIFELVRKFSPPIYTAFFVLAGAHIEFGSMTLPAMGMTVVYVVFRVGGKVIGSSAGARFSGAPAVVRKYLGMCLLPQAGVAIGLAILSGQLFDKVDIQLSKMIVVVVMTGTFIVEVLGPILVKVGVKRAGEVGMNVTEEDLIKTYTVADVVDTKVPVIEAGTSLREVINIVSGTESFYYSVVDKDKKLIGTITLEDMRNTFLTQELNDWLVALDIMEPVVTKITPEVWLSEAFETARRLDVEHLPVVTSTVDDKYVGVLNCRTVRRLLSAEVLSRQQKADRV